MNKNYDQLNKYNFFIKYYMHYAIGTKYEDLVEIKKEEYEDLLDKLNNSDKAMIKVFATYIVGFYNSLESYELHNVSKEVFYCLLDSQRYERNKRNNENSRYIDSYITHDEINNLCSEENIEENIIEKITNENINKKLKSILTEKQIERLYKNLVLEMSLIEIAKEEKTDAAAISRCLNRAIHKLKKFY